MDWESSLSDGNEDLARQLKRLQPVGHRLNRDTLMYRAGQLSERRRLRRWQSAAVTMILLVAALGWLNQRPWTRGAPADMALGEGYRSPAVIPVAELDRMTVSGWISNLKPSIRDYLQLRTRVTFEGMDALPAPPVAPAPSEAIESIADWLRHSRSAAQAVGPFRLFPELKKGNLS
jgi:hypothetical protein